MALFEPVDNLTKLYVPLWWYGQVDKIDDHSPMHCDLTCGGNAEFGEHGYYFGGGNDYLIDGASRKVLTDGTAGEWSSIFLTDGDVPKEGSVQGTGTKLYLNSAGTAPKVTGKLVLLQRYCPNIEQLRCQYNLLTVLNVSSLIKLTRLYCYSNSLTVLDVGALTSLTLLYCKNNSISILDVSILTGLTYLNCHGNSISTLDVSVLTDLTHLDCSSNSMNQAMVDTILCDMDGHGTSNGTLNISGNAVPSATGITCKNNLIARGWTVTTD